MGDVYADEHAEYIPAMLAFFQEQFTEDARIASLGGGWWTVTAASIGNYRLEMAQERSAAELQAKRKFLEFGMQMASKVDSEWGDGHHAPEIAAGQCSDHGGDTFLDALRILVRVYVDRKGFKQEWLTGAG